MASARSRSQPQPPQPPPWRATLAAALRRIARAVAPPATAPRSTVVTPADRPDHRPQLPPPGVHASAGNGAARAPQSAIVDPLERARTALRDARQHMTALIDSDASVTAPPAEPPLPAVHDTELLHEVLVELREERRSLLTEIAGMRTLLQETRAEVAALRQALCERLTEGEASQRLPPALTQPALARPAPSLGAVVADAGDMAADSSGRGEQTVQPAHPSVGAVPVDEPVSERRFERQPEWAPFRDFGWRARPEASLSGALVVEVDVGALGEVPAVAARPVERQAEVDAAADGAPASSERATPVEPSAEAGAPQPAPIAPRISDFAPDKGPPGPLDQPKPQRPEADAAALGPVSGDGAAQAQAGEAAEEESLPHPAVAAEEPEPEMAGARWERDPAAGGRGAGQADDEGLDAVRLPAGSTRLVIGPVRSIGRLTALERRLVREPALAQVTLADFRRQLATIVVSTRSAIDFAALAPALADEERRPVAVAWQADGSLRVTLSARAGVGA